METAILADSESTAAAKRTTTDDGETTRPRKLAFRRYFTADIGDPLSEFNCSWERRDATIRNADGSIVFQQNDVLFPASWSETAVNVTASKYFHGKIGSPDRESSLRDLIERVVDTISEWGSQDGYFDREAAAAAAFRDELAFLLVTQRASFNSPVWFNCGVEDKPQCSACFINSVEDTMESILTLAKTEGMLFKWGSGTGSNLSSIRGSNEAISSGGTASGPVSFMKGFDSFAGVIRSGGKTRRAAKMVILNVDHPDIMEFIGCKVKEEAKAQALIDSGYDASLNGEAYESIQYQNANHSVRVPDAFMKRVGTDDVWRTKNVADDSPGHELRAREVFRAIAEAAHACGDPGIQFDDTINDWHTSPNSGRINASNPCSEYMYLDDSACNLASLNLMKFTTADGDFDLAAFGHAVDVLVTAMEIIVGHASYPTARIAENSRRFRPLGLGYANLGALLMYQGLPYDSAEGRRYAAAITSLMTARAYHQSARLAAAVGPFEGYRENRDAFLAVMRKHESHARLTASPDSLAPAPAPAPAPASAPPPAANPILLESVNTWRAAIALGETHGFRNGQATVLAPTGTIGLMMDCDTTGIEPDLSLIKSKKLVGGGVMSIVNQTVAPALARLGYAEDDRKAILDHVHEHGHVEGSRLAADHLPVFDCALKSPTGGRTIPYEGHIRMMAAVQPFLSGAISKTVNMPEESTVEDVEAAYRMAWRTGLKSIAIYRDGSKKVQPLNRERGRQAESGPPPESGPSPATPTNLPDERPALIHRFAVGGHTGYLTVGLNEAGQPREIFLSMSKQGSLISGLMDAFARAISYCLQYGVPLPLLVEKYSHTRYEPSGYTEDADIRYASSITDYVFRWLGKRFLTGSDAAPPVDPVDSGDLAPDEAKSGNGAIQGVTDSPPCETCGALMVRSGTCFKCLNCGSTSGCS